MRLLPRRARSALALAVIAAAVPLGTAATANAAVTRTADTTTYTSAEFLEQTLGLPDKKTHVIESVTYDRFQWLLQQEGRFAFLIGDPATDASFASRAQAVEDAAETAGVKHVYWFNPNLSGNAKIGDITEPNLDIRNPAGMPTIGSTSQGVYDNAWKNLVGRYLGNGVKVTQVNPANTGSAKVSTALDASVVNDYGANAGYSTKLGNVNGGALYDYTSGTPADVQDSFFLLYDKDNTVTPVGTSTPKPAKIYSWVNLTKEASATTARAAVTASIATCGAANIKAIDEFTWWKSAANLWQSTSSPNEYQGANHPVINDADGSAANGGWRVHQITYPELVFLLKTESAKEVVLLFGGTWCPNTRPVLPFINKYAQENDVTVFNWDTILDGSVVGGGNSASNPLQSRGPAQSGATANPSFIYGDLITQFLNNLKTEYKPDAANRITFYPGGDTTKPQTSQPRLQVPYLVGYKGGSVNRQWIHDKGNGDYTEYMSVWHFTNPKPNELGVTPANLPREAPIWTRINSQLSTFTWETDPEPLKVNTAIDTDDADFLVPADTGRVVSYSAPDTVTVASGGSGAFSISPAALSTALAALGGSAPVNYAAARAAYVTAKSAPSPDPTLVSNLETVVVAWGIAQQRKNRVNTIWGNKATPNSVAGGIAAVHAADVFFKSLPTRPGTGGGSTNPPAGGGSDTGGGTQNPGGGTPSTGGGSTSGSGTPGTTTKTPSKLKVSAVKGSVLKAQTAKGRGKYRVKITVPKGSKAATGKVTITLTKGKTKKTVSATLRNGAATITLPKLAKGTWKVTITWPGSTTFASVSSSGAPVKVTK